jgi:hypothetical protein
MAATLDKTNTLSHLTGFIFVLMAICDVYRYVPAMILAIAILSIVAFILHFPMENKNFFLESMLFIFLLLIMSLINLLFTDNGFGGSITLVGNLLLSYIYLGGRGKKMTVWIVIAYLITILFICYKLFVLNLTANELYDGLSRNHAGFVVIFWTVFLLFHLKVNYNIYLIILPLISTVLSFYLIGRTSLIVSLLLLFVVFFFKFKKNYVIRILTIVLVLGIGLYLWTKFETVLLTETNLAEGLDTPRWKLWGIYLENLNPINLFTGIDVDTLEMYDLFGGNPHNSFIKFHSRVGFGFIVFITLYFISVFKYLKEGQNYIFLLLMLLTLRAFFDSDILVGNFDFIFFIITFYWIKTEQYES